MKNQTTNFVLQQWQDNTTQMRHLLEQQERIITNLVKQFTILEETAMAKTDFYIKDDYVRIVVEIKARERIGELWPSRWHSLPMLADILTPIVGWIVSPNSLWRTMNKIENLD
ncbi:MAG TPA: hypothetical protein DIW30_00125 [Bacteroidales bacterium]|nr:hypothetical protein [Bacteroidales bacterium]